MFQQNLSTYRNLSLGVTGQVVAVGVVKLAGWQIANTSNAYRYIKFYDKSTAALATDTPVLTLALETLVSDSVLGPQGINFSAGLSVRATTGVADNDAGAPGSNDVVINLFYQLSGR